MKKMEKYIVGPEVAGQLGDNTVLNHQTKPPIIEKLHYEFDDWLGDDFLAGFRCFICTERLTKAIKESNLSGYKFETCQVSKSELFNDLNEDGLNLPDFFWFIITGDENDDFFIVPNFTLVISERALNILRQFNINYCDITLYVG
jgi:hypothetical protein